MFCKRQVFSPVGIALLFAFGLAGEPAGAAPENGPPNGGQPQAGGSGVLRATEIQLKNAVRTDPQNPKLQLQLGEIELKLGEYDAAEGAARKAGTLGASDDDVAPILAQAMYYEGKLTDLIGQVLPGTRPANAESRVRLALGLANLAQGDMTEANRLLQDAERLDDAALDPKIALSRLFLARSNAAAAQAELARAQAIAPDDVDIVRLQAELLELKGDDAGALQRVDTILAQHPDDTAALLFRAVMRIQQHDLAHAQADVDEALKIAPKNYYGTYVEALLAAVNGNLRRAEDLLSSISIGFTLFPAGYYLDGAVKYARGQYVESDDDLSKYLELRPEDRAPRRLLARVALARGNHDRAIELLKQILNADPADVQAVALLAQAYLARGRDGDKDAAVRVYARGAAAQRAVRSAVTPEGETEVAAQGALVAARDVIGQIADPRGQGWIAEPVSVLADLRIGAVSKAVAVLETMLRRDPKNELVQEFLGIAHARQKNYGAAEKIFEDLIASDPGFIDPRRRLANLYMSLGRLDDAKAAWQGLLDRRLDDEPALLELGQIAERENDPATAGRRFERARQVAPNTDPVPALEILELHVGQSDWVQVKRDANFLAPYSAGDLATADVVATALAKAGDGDAARKVFDRYLQLHSRSDEALEREAAMLLRLGDKAGARDKLVKALAIAPSNLQHLYALVSFDYGADGIDKALGTARAYTAEQPAGSAWEVADILVRANRLKDAIAALTAAQAAHPSSSLAFRLAQLLYDDGRAASARALLESWLGGHRDDEVCGLELAEIDAAEGESDQARQLYEQVLAHEPDNVKALNNLALLDAKASVPQARDMAERAYNLAPTPQTADTYGWLLASTGDADAALPFLQEASAGAPGDAEVQYHFAAALTATGDRSGARRLLERVLKSSTAFNERGEAQRLLDSLPRD
jgi:putative PEP-CTERM system TPR-repeat lipoprotein